MAEEGKRLRSIRSYGEQTRDRFIHRSWMKSEEWDYYQLYQQHVLQADRGCDFDFPVGATGSLVERESH